MDGAEMPSGGMEDGEVCVPLSALAQPDDGDQMQTPAEGDNVTMTVDATVTRIEGENAYLKPTSINGTDLEEENKEEEPSEPSLEDQEGALKKNFDEGGSWL